MVPGEEKWSGKRGLVHVHWVQAANFRLAFPPGTWHVHVLSRSDGFEL